MKPKEIIITQDVVIKRYGIDNVKAYSRAKDVGKTFDIIQALGFEALK